MVKRVNALKARKNLEHVIEDVYSKGDQYVIERAGRPMAAVVPVWQLEEWRSIRRSFFGSVAQVWRRNKRIPAATIEREVAEAVRAVRSRKSRPKG